MIKNKILLIPLIPLLWVTLSFCTNASEWTGDDKKLHFNYGVAIGGMSTVVLNFMEYDGYYIEKFDFTIDRPLTSSLACSIIAGVGKEIMDEYDYGGFDYKDALVTSMGCFLSSYIVDWGLNGGVTQDNIQLDYKWRF